jgi:hypothetical protein
MDLFEWGTEPFFPGEQLIDTFKYNELVAGDNKKSLAIMEGSWRFWKSLVISTLVL